MMAYISEGLLSEGTPEPLGVTFDGSGVNVAVFSAHATVIDFCLFDVAGATETARIRLPERTGDVFHGHVAGITEGMRYGLRAHGPFLPGDGHRFNPSKLLIDPYAIAIDRPFRLHPSMFGYNWSDALADLSFNDTDSGPYTPKAIVTRPSLAVGAQARPVPWSRTILYELHVRGFSKTHNGISEQIRGTFAALAHRAAIEHFLKLGITTLEIMPAAAWIEERRLAALGLTNYWGYNPVALMAPCPRLAPDGWDELRAAVAALAEVGIEVILDVVLNHTGEGDELGPTLSLRGLDNATYYRLIPGNERRYADDAGCGNTLALERPAVLRLAMDTLRTWTRGAGVSGFRFDLATTLGRRASGFDPGAPLLGAIAQDPELRTLKLIAEPWDIGPGGYQIGAFPGNWGEWNDRFRDSVRRFWRGDPGQLGELATRIAGSADLFGGHRRPSRSVNFVVAHDGFTLADLVAYARKHNDPNGEDNRDGANVNFSWNRGVEGPSGDPSVVVARARDQRALLATLLIARGTPMLEMGSELGHSQSGNNNAYAQDNATTWLNWEAVDTQLLEFARRLVQIRREHPALRNDHFLTGHPFDHTRLPDVKWTTPNGVPMTSADWEEPAGPTIVMTLCCRVDVGDGLDRVTLVLHRGKVPIRVMLPHPRNGQAWRILADSAANEEPRLVVDEFVTVAARSVMVIVECPACLWHAGAASGGARATESLSRHCP
jgi:isoamylase